MSKHTRRPARRSSTSTLTARDERGRFVALEIVEVIAIATVIPLRREVVSPPVAPLAAPLRREVMTGSACRHSSVELVEAVARVHSDRLEREADRACERRRARRQLIGNTLLAAAVFGPVIAWVHHLGVW